MHDVMRAITSPVHTTCLGHCESMAAVLLAAGERGHRKALPNSRIMVHQPTRSPGSSSKTSKQLLTSAQETHKSRLKLAALLARDTGRPIEEMNELIEHDQYFDAEEALSAGIIDGVDPQVLEPGSEEEKGCGVGAPEKRSGQMPAGQGEGR